MNKAGALLVLLLPLLTSCDSLHYGYIKNESDKPVDVTLSFNDFQAKKIGRGIRNYVKFRMEDSVIATSAKLTHLNNGSSRLSFSLCSGCQVRLLFDTAPIQYEYIEFDTLKIIKRRSEEIYPSKKEIFNAFIPSDSKRKRYLIVQ